MKKQKTKQSDRALLKQIRDAKPLTARRKRKLHVHIALHPMSILLLLCMGVLLVSFTLNAVADSYRVTAIVPAPPLTAPATILSPANGIITGTQAIAVGGSCPAGSYVELLNNGNFVGVAICSSENTFGIGVTLVQGSNQLRAQDYNITNSPGPSSNPVTITYVPGAPQLPDSKFSLGAVVVGQLVVTQVDINVPYQQKGTLTVSGHPTFAGVAPPLAHITVAVQSSSPCTTTANVLGYWNCKVPGVSVGAHRVDVSADSVGGAHLTFPTFTVTAKSGFVPPAPPLEPLYLSSTYSYRAYTVGQTVTYTITIKGGRAPFALAVSWGDDTATDLTIRMSDGTYKVSHTYGWISASKATKRVYAQAIDAAGQTALLQLDTVIRNPAYNGAIANLTRSSGLWGLFNALRPWLWLIWPGYLIVILLVFSFWLGEHQEVLLLRKKRRDAALRGKRRQAHAGR